MEVNVNLYVLCGQVRYKIKKIIAFRKQIKLIGRRIIIKTGRDIKLIIGQINLGFYYTIIILFVQFITKFYCIFEISYFRLHGYTANTKI